VDGPIGWDGAGRVLDWDGAGFLIPSGLPRRL
jgi:hypothetical protein